MYIYIYIYIYTYTYIHIYTGAALEWLNDLLDNSLKVCCYRCVVLISLHAIYIHVCAIFMNPSQ